MGSSPDLDETQRSVPAYADLTQTQGWAKPDVRIRADTNQAAEAVSDRRRSVDGPAARRPLAGADVRIHDDRIAGDDPRAVRVHLAVQAWHFKRLGAQLIGERAHKTP